MLNDPDAVVLVVHAAALDQAGTGGGSGQVYSARWLPCSPMRFTPSNTCGRSVMHQPWPAEARPTWVGYRRRRFPGRHGCLVEGLALQR
jgi:hypothetical protein